MNQNPLNFSSKKERNDFLIALAVLLFFGMLFWWLFTGEKPVDLPEVAKAKVTEVVEDVDGDGIADKNDKCPNLAGVAQNDGCPMDTDGDGIYDTDDKCPNYAGSLERNGCPTDTDGDGVHDGIDRCVNLAGIAGNSGCPADTDGDGVYDTDDKCPNRPGLPANDGCPKIKLDDTEKEMLNAAVKSVEFETGSATLKASSSASLDNVVALMTKYSAYKLSIKGHTDNQGDFDKNMALSDQRAKAAKEYLISKGISSRRITAKGFGDRVPIESNETPEGRQVNRRVEFDLSY